MWGVYFVVWVTERMVSQYTPSFGNHFITSTRNLSGIPNILQCHIAPVVMFRRVSHD